MKKIYLSLFVVSLVTFVSAQWQMRNSFQTSYIDNLSVVNSNVIWVADQTDQAVSISTDGGQSWIKNDFQAGSFVGEKTLGTFSAVNDSVAYIIAAGLNAEGAANNGVFKTNNGGKNWTHLPGAFSATSFPNFVYFWNINEGVAIGDAYPNQYFEIYTTSNAGQTWDKVQDSNQANGNAEWGLNSGAHLRVVNETIYFTTSGGRIFKSADKGKNWTAINTPATSNNYMSFDFKNDNEGMVVFSNSSAGEKFVYTTVNGGADWIQQTGGEYWFLRQIKYDASRNIYFSTSQYGLAYSDDNGATWTRHPSFINISLGGLQILPNNRVMIGGWGSIYYADNYTDTNPTVTSADSPENNKINVYFSDDIDIESGSVASNFLVTRLLHYETGIEIDTIPVATALLDDLDKKRVILTMAEDVPFDTITVRTYEIVSTQGLPVLFSGAGSRAQFIKTNNTGLHELSAQSLKVYPNPAKDIVNIELNENLPVSGLKIINTTGQLIYEDQLFNLNQGSIITIPLNMNSGVYYLQITNQDGQAITTRKLIKQE